MKKLTVTLSHTQYPIYIETGLLAKLPELLIAEKITPDRKLYVITDSNVAPLYLNQVLDPLRNAGFSVGSFVVPAGERSKSFKQVETLITECLQFGLDRQSVILALGGGVVGDLAGFVAAIYMRGISFIQIPTTLLAHDSAIGGKTGINHPLGKNMIGAFHQPRMVLFDPEVLHSLPRRELLSGFAEMIKHAFLWDPAFVQWLKEHAQGLLSLESERISEALYRSCAVKVAVVSRDEKEKGIRSLLNYGHTIGHALEAVTDYQRYTHGEAVAIGMAGAARLSVEVLGAEKDLIEETESLLKLYQLPTKADLALSQDAILQAIKRDKKAQNGEYTFVLAERIGRMRLVKGIREEPIRRVLSELLS
jgi:3-dehydroquinate synthase